LRSDGFSAQMAEKASLEEEESNSRSIAGWSKMDTLRIARDGGEGVAPSGVISELSHQLLNSCRSSRWASIDLFRGASFSSRGPYSMRSCFEAKATRWRSLGAAEEEGGGVMCVDEGRWVDRMWGSVGCGGKRGPY
jgi:hypothetical protein